MEKMEQEKIMEREIYTPRLQEMPPMPGLRTLYEKLGEAKIRELVDVFYNNVKASELTRMFPDEMEGPKRDQADFLIQVLGGPSLYTERKGPARMRMRHFPFEIAEKHRLIWLDCYRRAIQTVGIPEEERIILDAYLDGFSQWMVNAQDETKS